MNRNYEWQQFVSVCEFNQMCVIETCHKEEGRDGETQGRERKG